MYMKNKQYKHDLGSLFHLERNKYYSTLTMNIESSDLTQYYDIGFEKLNTYPNGLVYTVSVNTWLE